MAAVTTAPQRPVRCVVHDVAADLAPATEDRLVLGRRDGWPVLHRPVPATAHPVRLAAPSDAPAVPAWWRADLTSDTPVSVVVCTLGRDPRLGATITALLASDHRRLEVVVVDNAPAEGGVDRTLGRLAAEVRDDDRLRVVRAPRRGLSHARNAGLDAVRHAVVAFTDDDALPASDWVRQLAVLLDADARTSPGGAVTCVTGLVLPADLRTPDQALFEEAGGFAKGLAAVHWGPGPLLGTAPGPQGLAFPFDGGFGAGNNMAFRTAALRAVGGFDGALGAGTPPRGGEDLDVFQRIHLAGGTTVYWPAALVRHDHRDTRQALRAQLFGYGAGMSAVVAKRFLTDPRTALAVLRRVPGGLRLLLADDSAKNEERSASFPPELVRAELRGFAAGPFLYLYSRLRHRVLDLVRDRRRPRRTRRTP